MNNEIKIKKSYWGEGVLIHIEHYKNNELQFTEYYHKDGVLWCTVFYENGEERIVQEFKRRKGVLYYSGIDLKGYCTLTYKIIYDDSLMEPIGKVSEMVRDLDLDTVEEITIKDAFGGNKSMDDFIDYEKRRVYCNMFYCTRELLKHMNEKIKKNKINP